MNLTENAAYIKGLAEGMELDATTKEGKIILKLIDALAELSAEVEDLRAENNELYGYVEEMARDIIDIENDLYEDDEEYEDYSDLNEDEEYSDLNEDEEYSFDEDEEYYEVECPSCGEKICFTDELELSELVCPACGEKLSEVECDGNCAECEGCDEE